MTNPQWKDRAMQLEAERDEARERLAEATALVDLLLLNVDSYYGFWSIRFSKADETTELVRERARAWLAKGGTP